MQLVLEMQLQWVDKKQKTSHKFECMCKTMVSIFQNRMSNCLQKENAGIIVSYKVVIKLVLGFGSKWVKTQQNSILM